VDTNQRIQFDLASDSHWLASGDTRGFVNVWDLKKYGDPSVLPLHSDCCNGVALNPAMPILATSSGQFHFTDQSAQGDNVTLNGTETTELPAPADVNQNQQEVLYENAVVMWWCGQTG